ncbi:MAG: hypothetical protein IJT94_13565 [Oscillibacter sp.]|nr:hypothetical protein [Oscillibacter sp.]
MSEETALRMMQTPPVKRIPHMRTVDNIVKELRELDSDCEVSTYCIRQLVKKGYLRALPSGSKLLINLWDVLDLMNMGVSGGDEADEAPVVGGIRRVAV